MQDPEAGDGHGVPIHNLDRRLKPLPDSGSRRPAELNNAPVTFGRYLCESTGSDSFTVRCQHLGQHKGRVVALERNEGRWVIQILCELDAHPTGARAPPLRKITQDGDDSTSTPQSLCPI